LFQRFRLSANTIDSCLGINSLRTYSKTLMLEVQLSLPSHTLSLSALVDCGADSTFINRSLVSRFNLSTSLLNRPLSVKAVDGRALPSVTEMVTGQLAIGPHQERTTFYVADIGRHDLVLGMNWLERHDPVISFKNRSLVFSNCSCSPSPSTTPMSINSPLPYQVPPLSLSQISLVSAESFWSDDSIAFGMLRWTHPSPSPSPSPCSASSISLNNISSEEREAILDKLPPSLHSFADVFSKAAAGQLPPSRPYDLKIHLEEGKTPPYGPLYNLSREELKTLKEWLEDALARGIIRKSQSASAAPVFFIKKADGSVKLTIDYRGLNAVTKKNRGPLPRIDHLLQQIQGATVFSKLDLRYAYNLVRIAPGDEHLTAFRTHFGLFETLVMQYGLVNAPPVFQQFISDALSQQLGISVIVYIDDILIYSKNEEDHLRDVAWVLEQLRKHSLFAKAEKSEFFKTEVSFLGFIISGREVKMDPKKLATVKDWPEPSSVKQVQAFLGFLNFYRRFIKGFSGIARPLLDTTLKERSVGSFQLTEDARAAFQQLKQTMLKAPVLRQFDPDRICTVHCDASGYAISGIVSQPDSDGLLHPVSFYSSSLKGPELRWPIFDKEMFAIFKTLTVHRPWLVDSPGRITVYSDHANLQYFFSIQRLNARQQRWAQELADYDFKIVHLAGNKNPADEPSRRVDLRPEEEEERQLSDNVLLPPARLAPSEFSQPHSLAANSFVADSLQIAATTAELSEDGLLQDLKRLWPDDATLKAALLRKDKAFSEEQELFLHHGRLYVPPALRRRILQE
jgi:hypothetical protein